jgi:PleD family two-component response regulator
MAYKRILVVDDEPHHAKLIQLNLGRTCYDVDIAFDGVEALEKIKAVPPDMVIANDGMPQMGGLELLSKMLQHPDYREIPFIMIADDQTDAFSSKAWEAGVSSILTKPINPRELEVFVSRLFQSRFTGFQPGERQV